MNKLTEHRIKMLTINTPGYTVKITGDAEKVKANANIMFKEKDVQILNKVSDKSHRPDRNADGTKKGK